MPPWTAQTETKLFLSLKEQVTSAQFVFTFNPLSDKKKKNRYSLGIKLKYSIRDVCQVLLAEFIGVKYAER